MHRVLQLYKIPIALGAALVLLYGSFAYDLERHDFIKLITLYGALFGLTYVLIQQLSNQFRFALGLGVVFRLVFLLAIPNLSQDFYRFIWDGYLVLDGVNPYLFTPENYLQNPEGYPISIPFAQELYEGMGSLNGSHFTNYPPLKQLFFALCVLLGGKSIVGSVIAMHTLLVLADVWLFQVGRKLLRNLGYSESAMLWYFLNPFIIIELVGNLHFEGIMLAFMVYSLYLLQRKKFVWSGVFMAFSISLKLIPLLFLPILLFYFLKNGKEYWLKGIRYFIGLGVALFLTLLPFISLESIEPFLKTTALWFQNFEFNASVYYIIREIGYRSVGWNIIETAGKLLALVIFLSVMGLAIFRRNQQLKTLLTSMLFAVSLYYIFATTVHPWYIAMPLILGILSGYRYPIAWSFLVFFSYSAYGIGTVEENHWIIAIEYLVLLGLAFWEVRKKAVRTQKPPPNRQNT